MAHDSCGSIQPVIRLIGLNNGFAVPRSTKFSVIDTGFRKKTASIAVACGLYLPVWLGVINSK